MLLKLGVRTTRKRLVAFKVLKPGSNEIIESAKLSRTLHEKFVKIEDPTMIVYYGPKNNKDVEREIWIPIQEKVKGVDIKFVEPIRAGFLVMAGMDHTIEYYYDELYKHLEERGLTPSTKIFSIEADYQPEQFDMSYGDFVDEDAQEEWSTEILIPVEE
jgi:hypothetical protein